MNMGIIALLALVLIIMIGFVKKLNIGLLAIATAVVIGYASGQFSTEQILEGFDASLFITLLGVTFLFGIINDNGCLDVLINNIISSFGKRIWFIPILVFIIGWLIAALAGAVAALVFTVSMSIPLARNSGYNPALLMIIGVAGAQSGRFTSITPDGNVVATIMSEQGVEEILTPLTSNVTIGMIILSIAAFIYFKGYKTQKSKVADNMIEKERLTKNHWIALAGVLLFIFCVIALGLDAGLVAISIAMLLLISGISDEKEAFQNIPWNTILMVTGVGLLMNIVKETGGIDILVGTIGDFSNYATIMGMSSFVGGFMSWFSSTLGVVIPTLAPTVSDLAEVIGNNTNETGLLSAMIVGSSSAAFSPASSAGGLILSTIIGDRQFGEKFNSNKLFVTLFGFSIVMLLLNSVLAITGIFNLFN
ncbi:MAG: hypothetical protein L0J89_09215 [Tetragenococcus koreensis]|nr:hypothetical protein [Tetragenococcus koreensis]MDN6384753.1 hypothetical protein [Tetragenococcus koreensis]